MVTGMAPEMGAQRAEVLETLVRQVVVAQRRHQVARRGPPHARRSTSPR